MTGCFASLPGDSILSLHLGQTQLGGLYHNAILSWFPYGMIIVSKSSVHVHWWNDGSPLSLPYMEGHVIHNRAAK